MNDHDSEKVAGLLLSRGYRQVETPEAASMILYNTCSIREKAAQKVFSRLGEYRDKQSEGKVIGVLGCVAQQEGEDIFKRAPWVSLVCGSASYSKLPEMLTRLEAGNSRVTGLDTDTDETFETEVTRRDNPWRAYLTIIEGCDKACSYCVVPFTRGPERSRASDSILREVRQLAELGYIRVSSQRTLWKRLSGSRRFATTCICRCSPDRPEFCARCSGLIRAKRIWKRSR
jgi:tRNA-2-methylthio-N6-dimethylallyladenosine synthase